MKLLITSTFHKMGDDRYSFLVMDPTTKRITNTVPYSSELDSRPTHMPDTADYFVPFGITSGEGKIFVASNYNIAAFDQNTFEFIELVSTSGTPRVHGIVYNDGYIFRTNTNNDTISRINLATKEEIHFSFKTMAREETLIYPTESNNHMDTFHLNAIAVDGDNVYVLAHNRYQKRSEVFLVDKNFTSAEKLANLDYAQHNILVHEGKIYSFGSQRGLLVVLDLDTLKVTKRFIADADEAFLRGGAIVNGEILVFANKKMSGTFRKFIKEDGAEEPDATILRVDLETYQVISSETTDQISVISDIVVLP